MEYIKLYTLFDINQTENIQKLDKLFWKLLYSVSYCIFPLCLLCRYILLSWLKSIALMIIFAYSITIFLIGLKTALQHQLFQFTENAKPLNM